MQIDTWSDFERHRLILALSSVDENEVQNISKSLLGM